MTPKHSKIFPSWAAMFMVTSGAFALSPVAESKTDSPQAGQVVWEEDFSDPALGPWSVNYYTPSGGTEGRPAISLKDGNLLYTCKFLAAPDVRGYASASYHFKNGGAGFKLIDAPVLEMRVRPLMKAGYRGDMSVAIILNYKTYGGDGMWTSLQPWTQAEAGEWVVVRQNLYDHPIASGPGGKKLLSDISFFLQSDRPGEPTGTMEIDWIRLRRMTEEERVKVSVYDDLLTDFKMEPAPLAEDFFGLGFYGLSSPRWGGNMRVTLDQLARHWVNFMGGASGRFYQSVWNDYRSVIPGSVEADLPEGEEGRATVYVKTHRYLAPVFHEYGMYYLANLVGFAGGVESIALTDRNLEQMNKWADEIAVLKNEPNILGWFCADEAKPTYLMSYLVTKAMIETRARSKPAMVLLNNKGFLKAYDASHQVIFTDQYPILRPTRDDPWKILRWMTDIDKITGGKPHWFTSEAFCQRREPWHARPGTTDMRLMSWLATAGGAKVNCYFLLSAGPWWENFYIRKQERGDSMWCMLDCYGNETPRYRVFREYAAKIGPLGPLLAKAKLAPNPLVTADAPEIQQNGFGPDATKKIPAVHISALSPDRINGQILIAVNMDRDGPQPLKMDAPDLGDYRCYDLVSLKEVPRAKSGRFEPYTLRPGEGHPFILCDPATFQKVEALVLMAKARQALRVANLDLRMARTWKIDTSQLKTRLSEIEQKLSSDSLADITEMIKQLKTDIHQALRSDQNYQACKENMVASRKVLGRIEVMMNVAVHGENPKKSQSLYDLAQELLTASETFDKAMEDYYDGKQEGLLPRLKKLRKKVTDLEPAISKATGVKPGTWPFPEKPWLHR